MEHAVVAYAEKNAIKTHRCNSIEKAFKALPLLGLTPTNAHVTVVPGEYVFVYLTGTMRNRGTDIHIGTSELSVCLSGWRHGMNPCVVGTTLIFDPFLLKEPTVLNAISPSGSPQEKRRLVLFFFFPEKAEKKIIAALNAIGVKSLTPARALSYTR